MFSPASGAETRRPLFAGLSVTRSVAPVNPAVERKAFTPSAVLSAPAAVTARRTRQLQTLSCLAVVVLAAVIRLWGLPSQPMLYFDSGAYMGEGAFLASAVERSAAALVSPVGGDPLQRIAFALQDGVDGHPPDIAKPGHAILLGLSMLVLGKTAFAGALVSALAGIGTVAATYAIARRGWGTTVALIAASLLAISGQHVVYSREPLVEADGLFFATVAALVYLRATSLRGLLAAGALWGVSFTCNNRLSFLPAVFLLAELARWPGFRGFVRRAVVVFGGFALPPLAIEAAYLAAGGLARAAGARTEWLDYAQQLAAFSRMNPPDRLRFDQWPTYFVDLALMDGLPVLVLLLIGIGLLTWRLLGQRQTGVYWTRPNLLLAGSLLAPLALYSLYSTGEVRLRHFSLAIPWVMLTAAIALHWLSTVARGRQFVASVVALAVLALLAVPRIAALDTAPSGMAAVVAQIGDRPTASTNGPLFAFHGEGRTNARQRDAFVNVPADLPPLAARYSLLVVDMQAEVFAGELTDIYSRATPVFSVANGNDAWYLADLLEHFGSNLGGWNELLARWDANRAAASQLRVYDLPALVQSAT